MRKHTVLSVCCFGLGLAAFALYAAWAVHAGAGVGLGWTGLDSAWPYLVAGVLTVACAIVAFVRLAFVSQKLGFDDRAQSNDDG